MARFEYIEPSDVLQTVSPILYDAGNDHTVLERQVHAVCKLVTAIVEVMPSAQLVELYVKLNGHNYSTSGSRLVARESK